MIEDASTILIGASIGAGIFSLIYDGLLAIKYEPRQFSSKPTGPFTFYKEWIYQKKFLEASESDYALP